MAESVILIIFALLLALASFLIRKDQAIARLTDQVKQMQIQSGVSNDIRLKYEEALSDIKALQEKIQAIQNLAPGANDFDEAFKELKVAVHQAKRVNDIEQQLAALTEKLVQQRQALSLLETTSTEGQTLAEKIKSLVERAYLWDQFAKYLMISDAHSDPEALKQRLVALKKLETTLAELEPSQNSEDLAQDIATRLKDCRLQIDTLQGQIANLMRRFEGVGKGTEKPACWATPDGRPEYIFDVVLRSGGVSVHNNQLSHRAQEQAQLPLSTFSFDREVSLGQFRIAAQPLREWSQNKDCMFFVRIQDETGPSQKSVYKQKLRTVGEYFYYYERP